MELVKKYKSLGYSGVVITNHYSPMTFHFKEFFNKKKAIEHYLKGYREAKKYEDEDFSVLLGMEIRFYATVNDYLVYGITETFLENAPFLLPFYLKRAYKLFKKNGFITIQAHPFRPYIRRANPKYLDGVEIKNGKSPLTENEKALEWAESVNLKIRTAGSDCHRESGAGITGIITEEPIKTNEDLIRILESGSFKIIDNNI
jgi:hypothetical protein